MTAAGAGPERGSKSVVSGRGVPTPLGPYSQAVRSGDLLFVSGQAAVGDQPGIPVGDTFLEQARQAFAEIFPADPPARMTMQVGLAPGYLLSVAAVAVVE